MKNFHYTYEITHKITKRKYIGSRSSDSIPFFDLLKYQTSSSDKEFKEELKLKPENFHFVILDVFNNRADATNFEIFLHNKFDVAKNINYYNRSKQTSIGFSTSGVKYDEKRKSEIYSGHRTRIGTFTGKTHTPATRKLFSENNSEIIICPHCNLSGFKSLLLQWHYENCLEHPIHSERNLNERNKVSDRKTGKNNPMFGRTGVNNKRSLTYKIFDNCDNLVSTCVGTEITKVLKEIGLSSNFRWQFTPANYKRWGVPARLYKFEGWYIKHEKNT